MMDPIAAAADLDLSEVSDDPRSNWREILAGALEACQCSAAALGAQCEKIAQLEMSGLDTDQAEATLSRMVELAEQNYALLGVLLQLRDVPSDLAPAD